MNDATASPSVRDDDVSANTTFFLTLGDGDFTYSLDLARYLRRLLLSQTDKNEEDSELLNGHADNRPRLIKLVATGIDTLEDLTVKYKDTPFILDQIQQLQTAPELLFSIRVHHGVNAIVDPAALHDYDDDSNDFAWKEMRGAADHVLFHHPHLGTEDAALHCQFLSHLLYSAKNYWMKQKSSTNASIGGSGSSLFHLTLVRGQFERWNCEAAAQRHGLTLIHQARFAPPPINSNNNNSSNAYHYRRHQTGKSFDTRRPQGQSITYTFCRTGCEDSILRRSLPWQGESDSQQMTTNYNALATTCDDDDDNDNNDSQKLQKVLPCPFCDKEFREERSRKCHILDKHSTTTTQYDVLQSLKKEPKKQKLDAVVVFECDKCADDSGTKRKFSSSDALQAHQLAKHSGIHTYIAPDWSMAKKQRAVTFISSSSSLSSSMRNKSYDPTQQSSSSSVTIAVADAFAQATTTTDEPNQSLSSCEVCGVALVNRSLSEHLQSFTPPARSTSTARSYECSFCSKAFREDRARLQHENFCSKRM